MSNWLLISLFEIIRPFVEFTWSNIFILADEVLFLAENLGIQICWLELCVKFSNKFENTLL